MEIIQRRCFKIDRPNAFGLINGIQSIWCNFKDGHFPALIVLKERPADYKMSNLFNKDHLEDFKMPLKYIAKLDSQYPIKNSMGLWERIWNNRLADIWDPSSPYNFFLGRPNPWRFRIQLLRILEIKEIFNIEQIERDGWYDRRLREAVDQHVMKIGPVVVDEEFFRYKSLLAESVKDFLQ